MLRAYAGQGRIVGLLLAVVLAGGAREGGAQPSEKCAQERAEAENQYLEGQFDQVISLLQPCLNRDDLVVQEAVAAYRLVALAYLNKEELDQAQETVRALLGLAPAYTADPIQDPPSYATLVAVVRDAIVAEAAPVEVADPLEEEGRQELPEVRVQPPPEDPMVTPPVMVQRPSRQRRLLRSPKSWLLATGGGIVVVTAAVLAFGGGGDTSSLPPR